MENEMKQQEARKGRGERGRELSWIMWMEDTGGRTKLCLVLKKEARAVQQRRQWRLQ
jgi:hypothetical protein